MVTRAIFCCGCEKYVDTRLTDGSEIYPHRKDLDDVPFWKCDACGNHVGCHHKTDDRTRPLGCVPTKELKNARSHIHRILDPIWKDGHMKRSAVYQKLAKAMGIPQYHTAEIRTVEEARKVYREVQKMRAEL